jgi:surface antigen
MKILRNLMCFYLFSFLFAAGIFAAEATNTIPAGNDGKYKNYYSDGWFGTYALREFDKVAPIPGMNWFVEDAQDWLARAQRDGWVVKSKPSEAVSGAIIVGYNEGLVWVGVAREVTDQGLIFETVMGSEGKPARYWMKFSEIEKLIYFKGCILPQRIPNAKSTSPMADYKEVRGFTGSAWPVQEFDKTAPKPGFNWQGAEKDWPKEAANKGWRVMKNPTEIKAGGLIVFLHPASAQVKIAFVRSVGTPIVVFDFVDPPFSRVITARLTMEQLLDKNAFGGFVFDSVILPERTKR